MTRPTSASSSAAVALALQLLQTNSTAFAPRFAATLTPDTNHANMTTAMCFVWVRALSVKNWRWRLCTRLWPRDSVARRRHRRRLAKIAEIEKQEAGVNPPSRP